MMMLLFIIILYIGIGTAIVYCDRKEALGSFQDNIKSILTWPASFKK